MAVTVGAAKQTQGFADVFGGRQYNTVDYTAPATYNNTGTPATSGELLDPHIFGFQNTIQSVEGSTDQSGTYVVVCVPVNNGITQWRVRWFTLSGMTEIANNATTVAGKVVKLSAIGF